MNESKRAQQMEAPMQMIEKVARALCALEGHNPDAQGWANAKMWMGWQKQARTAIEAMREPTQEMLESVPDSCGLLPPLDCLDAEWRCMIDAALADYNKPTGD